MSRDVFSRGRRCAAWTMSAVLARRNYDLTRTEADPETKQRLSAMGGPLEFAGADACLEVIEREIRPRIAEVVPAHLAHPPALAIDIATGADRR